MRIRFVDPPPRESAGCREEQREHRVVDERENDEGVDKGEGRVNHARNLEGRHVDVPDAVHVQVEGEGIAADHQSDDRAADTAREASLADAQHRAAQHEGHADAVDDAQREVVNRREPEVRQSRGDLSGGRIQFGHARVRGYQRVDDEDDDRDDDHGRKHADDLHDSVEIQEGRENHEAGAHGTASPRGQTELLLKVRARAREHHEAHRETRKNKHHVNDATHGRVSDAFEDLVVVAGAEVGTQLEGDDAEDDVEDAQGRDADQALRAEGEEVLEQILAGRQARADDDPHVGEGDREVLF